MHVAVEHNVTTQWLTADASSVGHTVVSPDFFEGGIDITAAFSGHPGTTPSCFTTTVPDTRSSASPTATLFDFTLNQLGGCSQGLTTTAQPPLPGRSALTARSRRAPTMPS